MKQNWKTGFLFGFLMENFFSQRISVTTTTSSTSQQHHSRYRRSDDAAKIIINQTDTCESDNESNNDTSSSTFVGSKTFPLAEYQKEEGDKIGLEFFLFFYKTVLNF